MDFSTVLPNRRRLWANLDNDCSELVWILNNTSRKDETNMTDRELMNKMRKGMRVIDNDSASMNGTIVAFDYRSLHVGINFDNTPDILSWTKPSSLTIISNPSTEKKKSAKYPMPKRVIADAEAGVTVVLWDDGEKTIVRASEGETPDIYDAFCAAFCKRVYGTNSALKRELNKILVFNNEKKEE